MVEQLAWWRWVILFLLIGGMLGVWAWVNRGKWNLEFLKKKPENKIKVGERRYLGPKTCVTLIEVDGHKYLLAEGAGSVAWQTLNGRIPSTRTEKK
jgi:flagellar biogenesis protein FliO